MGGEKRDNVASVLVSCRELAVRSEIKRDTMLCTLHLSNKKTGETQRSPSEERASRVAAPSKKHFLKKATITAGTSVLAGLFMAVGETLTMQAHGAGTASLELRSSCLQRKSPGGFPLFSSCVTPPQ